MPAVLEHDADVLQDEFYDLVVVLDADAQLTKVLRVVSKKLTLPD